MKRLVTILPWFLLLAVAATVVWLLFPKVHPSAEISLPLTSEEILVRADSLLSALGVDPKNLTASTSLHLNPDLERQVQRQNGLEAAIPILRDRIPAYMWNVNWSSRPAVNFDFGGDEPRQRDDRPDTSHAKKVLSLTLDVRGRLLEFERTLPETASIAPVDAEQARAAAFSFLQTFTPYAGLIADPELVESRRTVEHVNRTDEEFEWKVVSPVLGNPMHVRVIVAGTALLMIAPTVDVPPEFRKSGSLRMLELGLILLYVVIFIGMIVVAIRRIRSYEIGYRSAIIVGIVTGILFDLRMILEITEPFRWEILFSLVLIPVVVGGGMLLLWAVADSLVRETWREKFTPFDLMMKGYFIHSRLGEATVRGIAIGTAALAVWLCLTFVSSKFLPLWTTHVDTDSISTFTASQPWLSALEKGYTSAIFPFAFFIVFGLSIFRRWIKSTPLHILVASFAMAILTAGHVAPLWAGICIQALTGLLFFWAFYRYEALTSFVGLFTWYAIQETIPLLTCGNPSYASSGWIALGGFGAMLLLSVGSLFRRNEITNFDAIAPAFVRHITERQRLQQELEIAREVQAGFLPKTIPVRKSLDIAARCVAAAEVGGDYYDFFELGPSKLAIAIGDVSGKGTQAAFFMTLTKGFLRALASTSDSPADILTRTNRLFYENVDRGMFISMVYAVVDVEKRVLTLARAGHNPVIVRTSRRPEITILQPKGLGLGLDAGETFRRSIEDLSIDMHAGDVFVFYTDGFSEAMNRSLEEFGEDRLGATVQKLAAGTAGEILEGLYAETRRFSGGTPQHDDMTMIVVKVTE